MVMRWWFSYRWRNADGRRVREGVGSRLGRWLAVPEGAELKPDLASDCLYTSPTTYQCDLPEGLAFHNGHELTASDVKFTPSKSVSPPRATTSTSPMPDAA